MRTLVVLTGLAAAAAACSGQAGPAPPPVKPTATIDQLMDGPIAHAAEVYWGSVSTIVDKNGITEHYPRTDEEWEAVWASAITLAESGNLLMLGPRARDDGDWMKFASAMVDAGWVAVKAAEAKSPDQVLEAGETVYNTCTACHMQYIPEDADAAVP
jgi:hypothetical protein